MRKRVFDLRRIDPKSGDIPTEQDELNKILQASVPGLISKPQRRSDAFYSGDNPPKGGPSVGHKLLVTPSVFNIGILLPPSLSFLQRLKDIVPPDSDIAISTLTSFLDDFLVNVFHPQFEETVVDLCKQSYTDRDAFEEDSQKIQRSKKPLYKVRLCNGRLWSYSSPCRAPYNFSWQYKHFADFLKYYHKTKCSRSYWWRKLLHILISAIAGLRVSQPFSSPA